MRSLCRCLTALIIITSAPAVFGDTVVPGGAVSGTWTTAGSPYLIQGDIIIHGGASLTIEPGVDLNFQGHYLFTVDGELQAVGTETDSINFYAADTLIGWKGISLFGTGVKQIEFSTVRYVRSDVWGVSAIFCGSMGHTIIAHSRIENNTGFNGGGLWLEPSYGANFTISHCSISHNRASNRGGGIYGGGTGTIEFCVISENTCYGAEWAGGGVYIYSPTDTVKFDHCTMSKNEGYVGDGLLLEPYSLMTAKNCIFEGHPGIAVAVMVDSVVTYSDFYNNWVDVYSTTQTGSGILVQVNANGDSCDIYGNIFLDPLFEDPDAGDYQITWDDWPVMDTTRSPCIDACDPACPKDPDGTAADMGALYYDQSCDCVSFCDMKLDGKIDAVDVVYLMNYVYKNNDARPILPACPGQNGDWNCNGSVDAVDVVWSVNYVYKNMGDGPCDPCVEKLEGP